MDIFDVLLDWDTTETITLKDEAGKEWSFKTVAYIPGYGKEQEPHFILKPLDKIPGIADDEVLVFRADYDLNLRLEEDEEIVAKVYEEYIKLKEDYKKE